MQYVKDSNLGVSYVRMQRYWHTWGRVGGQGRQGGGLVGNNAAVLAHLGGAGQELTVCVGVGG